MPSSRDLLAPLDTFARRHLGPDVAATAEMLQLLGQPSLDTLVAAAVPAAIRRSQLNLPAATCESASLA